MDFMAVVGEYFALGLLIATIASGVVYLVDKFAFEKKRKATVLAENPDVESLSKKEKREAYKAPLVADYCRSLFPVFLIVFIIRSFLGEPFKIPSGSMLPGYKIGDYLIVNKFAWGVRFPVWDKVILPVSKPKRGDVVIVHFPVDTKIDFIKRVVGVPGDKVSYLNKRLYVNGKPVPTKLVRHEILTADSTSDAVEINQEIADGHKYEVANMPWSPAWNFKDVVVPKGQYFLMGDNRDNSEDSRYWGFAPYTYLVGKPEMVFFSWGANGILWNRIGHMLS